MCDYERPPPPSASGGGTCTPGSSTTPCPGTTITARWVDVQAYCGDRVRLEATVTPAPPDARASIEVFHVAGGTTSTLETMDAPMTGGRISATWVAKAPTAAWRTDRIEFRVTAPGAPSPGTSTNQFTFRQRPTAPWTLIDVTHASGNGFGPSHEKHDARLEVHRVNYKIKIHLTGDPFDATKQTNARSRIEGAWNGGFSNKKFHRTGCQRGATCDCRFDCCKADWHLDIEFVASGQHFDVQVHATAPGTPPHRSSMNGTGGEWGDPPLSPATTYAHETGHVLGQADEYSTGATDPTGVQPAPPPAGEENLMSTPGNTRLLIRHYRWALKYLNDHAAGDPYETIQP